MAQRPPYFEHVCKAADRLVAEIKKDNLPAASIHFETFRVLLDLPDMIESDPQFSAFRTQVRIRGYKIVHVVKGRYCVLEHEFLVRSLPSLVFQEENRQSA
ncbi:putative methyltransferase [Pseudomonas phage UF_RH6]|nr:putative methyltransferase [Pseudomonas phage UF_RH6]